MTVLKKQARRPVTYDIVMPSGGLTESDYNAVAERFAQAQHRKIVRDTPWRRLMSAFGLFYIPTGHDK